MFLGLFDQPKDNEDFIKMERRYDQAKRERLFREQEAEKVKKANEGKTTETKKKEDEKKSKKQKFKEGFMATEAKLNKATDAGMKAYHKAEVSAERVNLGAKRFSEASAAFSINPSAIDMSVSSSEQSGIQAGGLDMFVPSTPKAPGEKRSGGVDLSLFDVSAPAFPVQKSKMVKQTPRGLSDPLIDAFSVRTSGSNGRKGKSDPFFDLMAVRGSQSSRGKKKSSKKQELSWF